MKKAVILFVLLVICSNGRMTSSRGKMVCEELRKVVEGIWKIELIYNREGYELLDIDSIPEELFIIRLCDTAHVIKPKDKFLFNPSISLFFYDKKDKNYLLKRCKELEFWSHIDIPMYFGENKEFFILTTWGTMNGGTFLHYNTKELRQLAKTLGRLYGTRSAIIRCLTEDKDC